MSQKYNSSVLCTLINSGQVRMPLSHTRALEVIAVLEGASNWNLLAHRSDAELLKARAKVLRREVNQRTTNARLSTADGECVLKLTLEAALETKPVMPSLKPSFGAQPARNSVEAAAKRIRLVPGSARGEWRWENNNPSLKDDHPELMDQMLSDPAIAIQRIGDALFNYPGDMGLFSSILEYIACEGNQQLADDMYAMAFSVFYPRLGEFVGRNVGKAVFIDPDLPENRPFYSIHFGYCAALARSTDDARLQQAATLATIAATLAAGKPVLALRPGASGMETMALPFPRIVVESLVRVKDWDMLYEAGTILRNLGHEDPGVVASVAATAAILGKPDAAAQFADLERLHSGYASALLDGPTTEYASLWTHPRVREAWRRQLEKRQPAANVHTTEAFRLLSRFVRFSGDSNEFARTVMGLAPQLSAQPPEEVEDAFTAVKADMPIERHFLLGKLVDGALCRHFKPSHRKTIALVDVQGIGFTCGDGSSADNLRLNESVRQELSALLLKQYNSEATAVRMHATFAPSLLPAETLAQLPLSTWTELNDQVDTADKVADASWQLPVAAVGAGGDVYLPFLVGSIIDSSDPLRASQAFSRINITFSESDAKAEDVQFIQEALLILRKGGVPVTSAYLRCEPISNWRRHVQLAAA